MKERSKRISVFFFVFVFVFALYLHFLCKRIRVFVFVFVFVFLFRNEFNIREERGELRRKGVKGSASFSLSLYCICHMNRDLCGIGDL